MSKKGKTIIWVLMLLIIGMLFVNMYLNLSETKIEDETSGAAVSRPYLQREDINRKIEDELNRGETDKIVAIYTKITGDPTLARIIMSYSIIYDIPTSLLFAIISAESGFNPRAVNKNSNRTYDYGLMSLNSRTFKGYSRAQLFEIDTNLRLGCEFLVKLKKRYKTWGESVIHYNGLYTKGAGSYMVKVMEQEREYEKLFNERIRAVEEKMSNKTRHQKTPDKRPWLFLFRV